MNKLKKYNCLKELNDFIEQLRAKPDLNEAAAASMPSGKYTDLELGASGTFYTAPSNGWFLIALNCHDAHEYINIGLISSNLGYTTFSTRNGETLRSSVPVLKGDRAVVNYTATGEKINFRYIYAEGSK